MNFFQKMLDPMGLFGGKKNGGMQDPNNYLQQMQSGNGKYLDPYIQSGQQANQTLNGQYQNLLGNNPSEQYKSLLGNNPSAQYQGLLSNNPSSQYQELANNPNGVMDRLGSGYQQSPGYQYNVDQATRASNNASSAGGFVGSPQQQAQMAKEISGMASQDYNQYLNNAMGLHSQGLQGMGHLYDTGLNGMSNMYGMGLQGMGNLYGQGLSGLQGMSNQGYGAAGAASGNLSDMLKSQAMLSYANAGNQNANQQNMLSSIGGMFGGNQQGGNQQGGFGGIMKGAGSGAASGSMFGPWGALIGAGVGGLNSYMNRGK